MKRASPFAIDKDMINLALSSSIRWCPGEFEDVPVCEEHATADDEVILFTDVNHSFFIVCEVTYSMLSLESCSVLVVALCPCIKVFKQM